MAKLEGKIFFDNSDVPFVYHMTKESITLGRSDQALVAKDPLIPAAPGVDVGLGVSNKLSRSHARLQYDWHKRAFLLHCLGKNGLTVTTPDDIGTTVIMTNHTDPVALPSRSLIQMGDCLFVFLLPPEHYSRTARAPSATLPSSRKRKKRDWIKAEHVALRALMMRLGYGRWDEIIAGTNGRLSEREPHEVIPVARKFVAQCYVHARPGVERKALIEILREEVPPSVKGEDEIQANIDELIAEAKAEEEPSEKRKYVRWARKLRLLRRLRDVHNHPSLERLRAGKLRVFTPPPALYWTSADDADLITGSYIHGYGATEAMRKDPELGFMNRYKKALPTLKKSSALVQTPVKATPGDGDGANGVSCGGDDGDGDDDDDDDEDEEDEEDEAEGEDGDDDGLEEGKEERARTKKLSLSQKTAKRAKVEHVVESVASVQPNDANGDVEMRDLNGSPDAKSEPSAVAVKGEDEKDKVSGPSAVVVKGEDEKGKVASAATDGASPTPPPPPVPPLLPSKPKARMVPKRGPRIGNEDGYNNPADAAAAAKNMADEIGLVHFPSSEALMRRLKSIINSCAKEYDRDQREFKKRKDAASRAQLRKDELAARKAEKTAERNRQREERRLAKSQPFSKKEALEFERALANFGVDYKDDGKQIDWQWFNSKVDGFDAKYAETLDAAYAELIAEAHRIVDLNAAQEDEDHQRLAYIKEHKKASVNFATLTLERAERLLERLRFFRVLRGEVLTHPALNSILRGFKKTRDLPLWWRSSHDRSLLWGVDRHGLNAWDFMGVDNELAFANSMKTWQRKNGNDSKTLKRAAMPKASSGIKRANALVAYFRSRANDPHFVQYQKDHDTVLAADTETKGGMRRAKSKSSTAAQNGSVKSDLGTREAHVPREGDVRVLEKKGGVAVPGGCRPTILEITDADGNLQLPADLGDGLYLLNLGELRPDEPALCENGLAFPVGLQTIRVVGERAFLCEILETSDVSRPLFRVSSLTAFNPSAPPSSGMWRKARVICECESIVGVWMDVANRVIGGELAGEESVNLASGPERYGLYEPTILYHIQRLPGASQVAGFEMRDFSEEGGGAKIVPSLGIFNVLQSVVESKLESPSDDSGRAPNPVLSERCEMEIPQAWIDEHASSAPNKRSTRRRGSSFY